MVKCLPEFEYFTVFLKNKNIFLIRRSKVTDYAALICAFSGQKFSDVLEQLSFTPKFLG